jgi:transglutaminase-like putative cysteine protease
LLSRNPEPFVEEHQGASLFQFKDIAQGTKAGVSVSYLVDVYAVETAIKPQAIKKDSASAVRAAYVQGNQYIPSDNPDILKMSAKIVGREKNPYVQANLVYDWMVAQGGIETGPLPFGAIESLAAKKSDAYSATLLFCALARSLDIPAQPVSGFLIDRSRKAYRHFWAEFWIDGFGWVPVDPAAGAGALPEGFGNRPDNRQFYFGNLDNQRVAFSRGISVVSQMDPRGRIVARDREYALQTLWEEATGGLESYSSLWSDLVVTGIY